MDQDELDRRNDEALAHLEDEWLEPDEDEGYRGTGLSKDEWEANKADLEEDSDL